jgi:hypothetical protein
MTEKSANYFKSCEGHTHTHRQGVINLSFSLQNDESQYYSQNPIHYNATLCQLQKRMPRLIASIVQDGLKKKSIATARPTTEFTLP